MLPETCRAKLDLSINKKVIVASNWLSSLPSLLMMHGQTNIKVDNVRIFMFKAAFTEGMKGCLVLFVYRNEPCDTIN